MRDTDFLIGFANLSVVLAGFVSIFLVSIARDGKLSPPDQIHFIVMLSASMTLLAGSLIPFIFYFFGWTEAGIYQASAAVLIFLLLLCTIAVTYRLYRLNRKQVKDVGYLHLSLSYLMAGVAVVLTIAAVIGYQSRTTYLSGLVVGFFIGALGFLSFAIQNFVFGREPESGQAATAMTKHNPTEGRL